MVTAALRSPWRSLQPPTLLPIISRHGNPGRCIFLEQEEFENNTLGLPARFPPPSEVMQRFFKELLFCLIGAETPLPRRRCQVVGSKCEGGGVEAGGSGREAGAVLLLAGRRCD